MTTATTDLSEIIVPSVIAYLSDITAVQDVLGRNPVKLFGGAVPEEIEGTKIKMPYARLDGAFDEEMCFSGGTGCFRANISVSVVAATLSECRKIMATLAKQLRGKYSETWGARLFVGESQMDSGAPVPIMLPDGYPAPEQQVVAELFLLCQPLAVA